VYLVVDSGELAEDMVREVERLPLVAFAAAQLWEKRDREKKVLTRAAYEEIGRAGGALAQHAERTLQSIGAERQSTVREIFRNLTTSQGTRVSMGKDELLSIFPDREIAGSVLSRLIDARLLTSSESGVEIVHESLLTAWPRLTQWQAQDAEGTVLRDQLREASRTWQERGTGSPWKRGAASRCRRSRNTGDGVLPGPEAADLCLHCGRLTAGAENRVRAARLPSRRATSVTSRSATWE
jgi:hypothetical protein